MVFMDICRNWYYYFLWDTNNYLLDVLYAMEMGEEINVAPLNQRKPIN